MSTERCQLCGGTDDLKQIEGHALCPPHQIPEAQEYLRNSARLREISLTLRSLEKRRAELEERQKQLRSQLPR